MTFFNLKIDHDRSPEADAWIKEEAEEQEERFAKIDKEMDDLKEERAVWYEEFFHRIQTKGFNTDGDERTKIKSDDIPVKPEGRLDQVIWKYGELDVNDVEGK